MNHGNIKSKRHLPCHLSHQAHPWVPNKQKRNNIKLATCVFPHNMKNEFDLYKYFCSISCD